MKKKSICLIPKAGSLGGPRTFQQNLISWAEQSGRAEIHFDPDREDIDAFLVIGGPKKYIGRLLKARRRGIPVVHSHSIGALSAARSFIRVPSVKNAGTVFTGS